MIFRRLSLAIAFGLTAGATMATNCQRGCNPPPVDPPPPPPVIVAPPPAPQAADSRDPWLTDRQVSYSFCCPWRGQLRMHTAFGRDAGLAHADCLARDTTARQCPPAIGRQIDRADARMARPADWRAR